MRALRTDPEWVALDEEAEQRCNMTIGHFVIGHQIVHVLGDMQASPAAGT
jgi:hypothetical protein